MKILDILNAPWAIEPSSLLEIQAIYATHLRGEKIDIQAIEARLGRPLVNEQAAYQVIDGVAVLSINGVMAKRMNMFGQISGGMSTQIATRDLLQAADDPNVHSIIQVWDTPGGTVDGTSAFANAIRKVGQRKTVIALADGKMASAGVWAGSAASKIYIADITTEVGSIGVAAQHIDTSGADAQDGIKRTDIYAGKYKRIASNTGPLSEAGLKSLQDQVDYTYSLFVQAVAANRGVSVDTVLENMADGRMFIGEQAISAGLVDGVSTLGELIDQLNQDRTRGHNSSSAGVAHQSQTTQKGKSMLTAEQVAAEHPAIAAAFIAQGAAAERTRILAVEGQLIPGHEALIASLKADGTSTAGDAAMAVNAAEKQLRITQAAASANDAPKPLAQKPAATGDVDSAGPAADAPIEDRAKAAWDKDAKLRAEFGDKFATYLAYAKAHDAGNVRVLSGGRAA